MKDEKIIVIDINLTRGLVGLLALALLVAAFGGYLAWNQGEVAASGPQSPLDHAQDRALASSSGMRGYYLTPDKYEGDSAPIACAEGYHFASLWEIVDPSNLKYNTALGLAGDEDDSGQGPPTDVSGGWVRTGYSSNGDSTTPGVANCEAWGSESMSKNGTLAFLDSTWDSAGAFPGWGFKMPDTGCASMYNVWCVED